MAQSNKEICHHVLGVLRKLMLCKKGYHAVHPLRIQNRKEHAADDLKKTVDSLEEESNFKANMDKFFLIDLIPFSITSSLPDFFPILSDFKAYGKRMQNAKAYHLDCAGKFYYQ